MITVSQVQEALPNISLKVEKAKTRLNNLRVLISAHAGCIGHSGGKDSVVNHWLVSQLYPLPVVHTAKPGGDNAIHPDTLTFLYQRPFAIEFWPRALGMNPKYNLQFDGSRASEFDRNDRSADFIVSGKPVNRKDLQLVVPDSMFGMTFIFPIFDWSDADVWACILRYELPYSDEYVDEAAILAQVEAKW